MLGFTPLIFSLGRYWRSVDGAHRKSRYLSPCRSRRTISALLTATFRELGPPDLCHVVKTTGKTGQRDVRPPSPFASGPISPPHTAWLLPLCLRGRCELLRLPRSLYQLAHVRHRGHVCVVLQRSRVEGTKRVLLLFQCIFEGRRAGGRQDSWRGTRLRGRFAWGAVRLYSGFRCPFGRARAADVPAIDTKRRPRYGRRRTSRRCCARYYTRTIRRIGWRRIAGWIRSRRARGR